MSSRLLDQGAIATLLVGSHARGRAGPHSDIDLFAIGDGPAETHEVVDGQMVSVHWWTPDQARRRMSDPESVFVSLCAWRTGRLIDDPSGVGGELQLEASEWSWQNVDREANAWVCARLVETAELVPKLAAAVKDRRLLDAAALRARIVLALAELIAVVRRLTAPSENGFWESLADAGGPEWRDRMMRALGVGGDSGLEAAEAAVSLFELLTEEVRPVPLDRQAEVLDKAVELARVELSEVS